MTRACCYCGTGEELRPYGPGGALVCYGCASATPERRAEVDRHINAAFDLAQRLSPKFALIVDEHGMRLVPRSQLAQEVRDAIREALLPASRRGH